jgi:hypothetical protein
MLKIVLGLIIVLATTAVAQAQSQLKPFDVLWHCDRVTNSIVEMATEIGASIHDNGEAYTDEAFATKVFTAVSSRGSMSVKRMEYDRTPQSAFYSAALYEKLMEQYRSYVVDQRKDFASVNSAIISTHVFRTCINNNLALKSN